MNTKKQIKKLLKHGKSQSAIARQLCISERIVRNLKHEIIRDKSTWNKKKKILQLYHPYIVHCLAKRWPVKKIHAHLLQMKVNLSYATVARFVAGLRKADRLSTFNVEPGVEAKIFLIPAGQFLKDGIGQKVWVFVMKLSYSKYSFCQEITDPGFESFLQCNRMAFAFYKAIPRLIKLNRTLAFNINDPILKSRYLDFLNRFGVRLFEKSSRNCFMNCPTEVRFFKEQFMFQVLHRDYKKLSKDLKRWYTGDVNLGIHPFTKRIIQKEFAHYEKPKMLVYDQPTAGNQN